MLVHPPTLEQCRVARVRSDRVRAHSSNFGVAWRTLYGDHDETVAPSAFKRLRSQALAVIAS
jgi:hypothetical protein